MGEDGGGPGMNLNLRTHEQINLSDSRQDARLRQGFHLRQGFGGQDGGQAKARRRKGEGQPRMDTNGHK